MSEDTDKNLYELAYLLPPEQEGQVAEQISKIKKILEQQGGAIVKEQAPILRHLSYPIAKQKQSLFGYLRFTIDPEKITELQKVLRLETKTLRFTISAVTFQQLQEEEKQARQPRVAPVAPTYTPKPKEATPEIKPEEFEKKLEEILKE